MFYFFLGVIPLPVTPAALTIKTPSMNKTITLINEGEVNLLKSPGLKEISFDFLLPRRKYPWVNYSIASDYTAAAYIPMIQLLKESKVPFPFIVTRMSPDNKPLDFNNITCQIEDYTFDEDAASLGSDVMCRIFLKEYKDFGSKSFSLVDKLVDTAVDAAVGVAATAVTAVVTNNRSTASKTTPKKYTVKKGDTLWNICKKELGDGQKYKEIAKLNKLENPDKIYPGQELRLS